MRRVFDLLRVLHLNPSHLISSSHLILIERENSSSSSYLLLFLAVLAFPKASITGLH
jgi:hypothetical protein